MKKYYYLRKSNNKKEIQSNLRFFIIFNSYRLSRKTAIQFLRENKLNVSTSEFIELVRKYESDNMSVDDILEQIKFLKREWELEKII